MLDFDNRQQDEYVGSELEHGETIVKPMCHSSFLPSLQTSPLIARAGVLNLGKIAGCFTVQHCLNH